MDAVLSVLFVAAVGFIVTVAIVMIDGFADWMDDGSR